MPSADHLEEQVADKHRVELAHVITDYHARSLPTPEDTARAEELQRLIDRMGEINLTAIDEYEELKAAIDEEIQLPPGWTLEWGGQFENLDRASKRLTVVVQSEFGRRIRENASRGTDHGTGNLMMVMGGNVVGGIHGEWPGLHPDQLYDNADLAPTTDYRRVLSDIVIRRLENPRLGQIFPGYNDYTPLGVVTGEDLPPDFNGAAPSKAQLPFKNLTTLGDGWKNSPWFGAFQDDRAPWIYHREHGFLYVKGTDETNLWLYQPSLGWIHTGQGIYPHLYSRNRDSWIFHEAGSREPRHFYDFSAQEWFSVSN